MNVGNQKFQLPFAFVELSTNGTVRLREITDDVDFSR